MEGSEKREIGAGQTLERDKWVKMSVGGGVLDWHLEIVSAKG